MSERSNDWLVDGLYALSMAALPWVGSCTPGPRAVSRPDPPPEVRVPSSQPNGQQGVQQPTPAEPKSALDSTPPDPAAFDAIPCGPHESPALDQIRASRAFDFLELRSQLKSSARSTGGQPSALASVGAACSGASGPGCASSLHALSIDSGFAEQCIQLCSFEYLVGTHGDQVFQVASLDELEAFLGPIDAPVEAQFVAQAHGYSVSCGDSESDGKRLAGYREVAGGYQLLTSRLTGQCPMERTRYVVSISRDARLEELWKQVLPSGTPVCIGRRLLATGRAPDAMSSQGVSVGGYFARMARLEAESVFAFEFLERDLTRHGAPRELIDATREAAEDEVRHTGVASALARQHGAEPERARPCQQEPRCLTELAVENASEGCLREALGAVVGSYQARAAGCRMTRLLLSGVARDELRHASLSYRIGAWLWPRLSRVERARVLSGMARTTRELRCELALSPASALQKTAGLPDARRVRAMVHGVTRLVRSRGWASRAGGA